MAARMPTILEELNAEIAALVQEVLPSLVQIQSGRGNGAGTIWHPDGLIVTNAHVVQRQPLSVTLSDGRSLKARLLARDSALDLAALVVDANGLPTIKLEDSRRLRPGELVMALGHPWGVRGAVTAGVVIGTEAEDWTPLPIGRARNREWILVDVMLRPGNSGGPLVSAAGGLLGLNTMVAGPSLGIAVPVHVAVEFLRNTLRSPRLAAA